jgi:bacterioferritin-associated ferredoxin
MIICICSNINCKKLKEVETIKEAHQRFNLGKDCGKCVKQAQELLIATREEVITSSPSTKGDKK